MTLWHSISHTTFVDVVGSGGPVFEEYLPEAPTGGATPRVTTL